MIRVLLYGVSTAVTVDQNELLTKVSRDHGQFQIKNGKLSFDSFDLIIAHDGLPQGFQQQNKWLIETSLGKTDRPPVDKNTPGTINWNTLLNGLEDFLNAAAEKDLLSIGDIHKLYGYDPFNESLIHLHKTLSISQIKNDTPDLGALKDKDEYKLAFDMWEKDNNGLSLEIKTLLEWTSKEIPRCSAQL